MLIGELASGYHSILLARSQPLCALRNIYYYTATIWFDYLSANHFQTEVYNDPFKSQAKTVW